MDSDFSQLFGDFPQLFDRVHRINSVECADLPTREKLDVLSAAWMIIASTARTEALAEPDGFPAERARQVERLRRYAEMIAIDEPDMERERLWHEGDHEAIFRRQEQHLQKLKKQRDEGAGE